MPNYPRKPQRLAVQPDNELGLPALTAKQEAFAHALLDGKRVGEAYRLAYDCTRTSDAAVAANATRLKADAKIALYMRTYQRLGLQEKISKDSHLAELARLRELAVEERQISAGVQAEHYRGKVAGYYDNKLTLAIGPSDDAILSQLEAFLGQEVANAVSQGLGKKPRSAPLLGAQEAPVLDLGASDYQSEVSDDTSD